MLEHDPASGLVCVHLLLNRASAVLDVESHLPHEGRVTLRIKRPCRPAVRLPRWVDLSAVRVTTAEDQAPTRDGIAWLGRYALLPEQSAGTAVTLHFPMTETTETVELAWPLDQFWLESTRPSAAWRGAAPTRFTLTFRGNTLADISPRDDRPGYPLYQNRSLEALRQPALWRTLSRFVAADGERR